MPKFSVEYCYPVLNYSEFEIEADSLDAAEQMAGMRLVSMEMHGAEIECISEVKEVIV